MALVAGVVERLLALTIRCSDVSTVTAEPLCQAEVAKATGAVKRLPAIVSGRIDVGTNAAQSLRHVKISPIAGEVERLPALETGCSDVDTLAVQPSRHIEMALIAGEMERLRVVIIASEEVGALAMQPLRNIEMAKGTGAVDRLMPALAIGLIDIGALAAQSARLVELAKLAGCAECNVDAFDVDGSSCQIIYEAPGPGLHRGDARGPANFAAQNRRCAERAHHDGPGAGGALHALAAVPVDRHPDGGGRELLGGHTRRPLARRHVRHAAAGAHHGDTSAGGLCAIAP